MIARLIFCVFFTSLIASAGEIECEVKFYKQGNPSWETDFYQSYRFSDGVWHFEKSDHFSGFDILVKYESTWYVNSLSVTIEKKINGIMVHAVSADGCPKCSEWTKIFRAGGFFDNYNSEFSCKKI